MAKDNIILVIITVYVAIVIVQELSKQTPSFGVYGWGIIAAFVSGAIYYYKNKYFGSK